jgi:hypothetical protein
LRSRERCSPESFLGNTGAGICGLSQRSGSATPGYNHFVNAKISTARDIAVSILTSHQ